MNTQTVFFLSILRRYMKVYVPVIAILLTLISPSLALAVVGGQGRTQAYVRVWGPTNTQSISLKTLSCQNGTHCDNEIYSWCKSPISEGGYTDLGWQGWIGNKLVLSAFSQPNCSGDSIGSARGFIHNPGDCWFDIPDGSVSGACNGKIDPRAG